MADDDAPAYVGLAPMLPVTNVPRAVEFYQRLGFKVGNSHTPEGQGTPVWAWMYNGRAHLMVNQADDPIEVTHRSAALWIYTGDLQATYTELQSRGLDVGSIDHPFYNPGGEFHVHDPDGYAVYIAHGDWFD